MARATQWLAKEVLPLALGAWLSNFSSWLSLAAILAASFALTTRGACELVLALLVCVESRPLQLPVAPLLVRAADVLRRGAGRAVVAAVGAAARCACSRLGLLRALEVYATATLVQKRQRLQNHRYID